jgi:hypothetical protein
MTKITPKRERKAAPRPLTPAELAAVAGGPEVKGTGTGVH